MKIPQTKNDKNVKVRILLVLMISFCVIASISTYTSSQDREEMMVHKKFGDVPIKLVSVSAEKKEVSLEKAFPKAIGWYKDLEFEIENTSGKTITHMSIELRFNRPKELKDAPGNDKYGFTMHIPYGGTLNDFFKNKPSGVEIKPGETVKIPLKENYCNALNESLTRLGYPSKFQGVEVVIEEIGFSDRLLWSYALWYKQDPENPDRWAPILEKKADGTIKPF